MLNVAAGAADFFVPAADFVAPVLGAVFVWAAGVSGAVFLIHNKDLSSFLMALFFGAAMLSYATLVFLLMHAPETETAAPRATATT